MPEVDEALETTAAGGLDPHLVTRLKAAETELLSRPRLSIRVRLLVSLVLGFALCCAFALATLDILEETREALESLEVVDRVSFEVRHAAQLPSPLSEEARGEALTHANAARAALAAREIEALGARAATLATALDRYRRDLISGAAAPELRASGAEVLNAADRMLEAKRAATIGELERGRRAIVIFLVLLLLLFLGIAMFFTRALVTPIRRFGAYTARIAQGDFTLIRPARPYRDEFTDLALAVNRMLAELQTYQDRAVTTGKLTAVGTMTSGIAHELANPLNNISITIETLLEELDALPRDEQWKMLQDIYFETERASEIVKSLLAFAREERREPVPVDLADIVQSTHRLAQNEMALNRVTFSCELPPDLPPARGAANLLRQVFLNLFLNAVQAMPDGGRLRVTGTAAAEKVCIEVHDEGIGIPSDVLPHIFDPFFTTKEPGHGTGLGLSVSWSIIRKLGGEIRASSEPGKGSVFHVCLPRAAAL